MSRGNADVLVLFQSATLRSTSD